MANGSSFFNQPSSSIMQGIGGVWKNEETGVKKAASQRTKALVLFPEHHDQESHADSHVVPDEDDIYEVHHPHHDYNSQVAPKVARKINLFDLEKTPEPEHDIDDNPLIYTIITPKTNGADYKDLVVPHQPDDCELPNSDPQTKPAVAFDASNKHTNEAEVAIVPSLSVCSNDPQPETTQNPDQDQVQSVREAHHSQALAKNVDASQICTPAKRKYARARTTEKQRVKINKKMRTLQGLIPTCNDKVDKASILDEAIIYVKALQLQLQMMSMPPMHLSYLPTAPMLGFPSFVPLPPPLLVPHPSISISNSINSVSNISTHHLLQHHRHHHHQR